MHYKGIELDGYTLLRKFVWKCDTCNSVFKENMEKEKSEHVETERERNERERREMEDWERRRQQREADKEWNRNYDWMSDHY